MLTDNEIQGLIASSKLITNKSPARSYREEDGYRRGSLTLESVGEEKERFSVFIRQNIRFIENYSIGLRYQTQNKDLGSVTLIRYNGPHGESNRDEDGHFGRPHIHRITAEELQSGSLQPQESHREITDRYSTFENALVVFLQDVGVTNWKDYFPELNQGELFGGHP